MSEITKGQAALAVIVAGGLAFGYGSWRTKNQEQARKQPATTTTTALGRGAVVTTIEVPTTVTATVAPTEAPTTVPAKPKHKFPVTLALSGMVCAGPEMPFNVTDADVYPATGEHSLFLALQRAGADRGVANGATSILDGSKALAADIASFSGLAVENPDNFPVGPGVAPMNCTDPKSGRRFLVSVG
jgi:hypothetical protein